MTNKTILLVEDNADDEALTLRALKRSNFGSKVFVVRDGQEALDFLFCENKYADRNRNEMPELTLLDIKLPKIDGLEVLRRVRADEGTRALPIVIFSSSKEEQDVTEAYKNGANSYVRKSINFLEFMEAIQQVGRYWMDLNQPFPS